MFSYEKCVILGIHFHVSNYIILVTLIYILNLEFCSIVYTGPARILVIVYIPTASNCRLFLEGWSNEKYIHKHNHVIFFHLAACIFWRSAYRGDELGACNYAPNNYFSASQQHPNDWTGYRHPSLKRTSCTETEQNLWPVWCTGLVDLLFVMLSYSWSLHLTEIPLFDLKKPKNIKSATCRRVIKFNWYYFTSWLQFDQCCACLKMWSQPNCSISCCDSGRVCEGGRGWPG
jgi:hypothetical protein